MRPCDVVLHRGNSVLQHGHFNNRVYIMKLAPEDIPEIIHYVDGLVRKESYTKIFVKVPESSVEVFARAGYITEATVPFFYHGKEPAVFMAKYSDPERKEVGDAMGIANVLTDAFCHIGESHAYQVPDGFSLMHAHTGDAKEIAAL